MDQAYQWAAAILLGLAGWQAAIRLRFPAPTVLGTMLAVGTASALGLFSVEAPPQVRVGLQMVIGTFAGYRLDRHAVEQMRRMGLAAAAVTAWTVLSALLIGYLLALVTGFSLPTALLGTAPGGLPEMSAMALGMHADVAMVATISASRLVGAMLAIPFLARRASTWKPGAPAPVNPTQQPAQTTVEVHPEGAPAARPGRLHWLWSVTLGVAGGLLFVALQIPAAGVMGSMIAVAAGRIGGLGLRPPPPWLRTAVQLGIGLVIGTTFDQQTVAVLGGNALAVLGAATATVGSSLILGGLVERTLKVDRQTAFLACSPAGVSQMVLLSEELGAQTFVVSLFQISRLTTVVLVMPFVFRLLLQ